MTHNQHRQLDWLLTICGIIILICALAYFGHTQDSDLTEHQKDKLTIAFQKAILTQTQWQSGNCEALSKKLAGDTSSWNKAQADVAKERGLPEGTTFRVANLDEQKFTVVLPIDKPAAVAPILPTPKKIPPPDPTRR